jgi:hypothetical protein
MYHRLSRLTASLALATTLLLGTALPANAYPPNDAVLVSETSVDPGGSVRLSVAEDTFAPGEQLTITVRGENASGVTFGLVRTAVETKTYSDARANAAGGLDPLAVTFPANAGGAYTIAVFSPSSPGDTVTVTVGALSVTGINSQSLLGLWVGGGALVLAGVTVLAAALVARRRRSLDAA